MNPSFWAGVGFGIFATFAGAMVALAVEERATRIRREMELTRLPPHWQKVSSAERWGPSVRRRFFLP